MDEVDSIGGARVEGERGGDSEVQRTMLELLAQVLGVLLMDSWTGLSQHKILKLSWRLIELIYWIRHC